jgi:hypothetical protein
MSGGAACPDEPPPRQINPNASHTELSHNDPIGRIASAHLLNRRAKMPRVVHDPG